jgi:D-amino peptidase
MRVYILTDLEGVSGITLWSQCGLSGGASYEASQRLLMADVNAAVDGCLDGGATQVVVLDGHGLPFNMVSELMHPRAEYICGKGLPLGWGMDQDFAVGMQVGAHAMNRTKDGVLCHTQNHVSDARYWYNGRETGELGQGAIEMGHFGFPCAFVSGDVAACREAKGFFGENCVTVAVKQGMGRQCAQLKSPTLTRELIRAGACEAMKRYQSVPLYTIEFPAQARLEALEESAPDDWGWEQIEAAPHRVHEGVCPTALDIYGF